LRNHRGTIRTRSIRNRGPLSSSSYERRIAKLQDQLEQAQQTILQLKQQLLQAKGKNLYLYKRVKLTNNQRAIVDMILTTNGICTSESLYAALYRSREGYMPDPHVIREMLRVIRKQLKPYGIDIENVRGTGYTMTSESKSKLSILILKS